MEFDHVGKRCCECNFQDFLPFYCNMCNKYYCKEHRKDHICIKKNSQKYKTINCPMCFKDFILEEDEDENNYILKHFENNCSAFKEKCSFTNCNNHQYLLKCSKCNKKYCIKHRHHSC